MLSNVVARASAGFSVADNLSQEIKDELRRAGHLGRITTWHRQSPPAWDPTTEVPYQQWTQTLLLWCLNTAYLNPSEQVRLIIAQLSGVAREVAETLTQREIEVGGLVMGNWCDPLMYLMAILAEHFGPTEADSEDSDDYSNPRWLYQEKRAQS